MAKDLAKGTLDLSTPLGTRMASVQWHERMAVLRTSDVQLHHHARCLVHEFSSGHPLAAAEMPPAMAA